MPHFWWQCRIEWVRAQSHGRKSHRLWRKNGLWRTFSFSFTTTVVLWYCVSDCLQKTNENYSQPSPPKTITRKFLLQQLLCNWFHPVTPRNPAKVVSHPKWWTTFVAREKLQKNVHRVPYMLYSSLFYHVVLSLHPFTYVGEIQP